MADLVPCPLGALAARMFKEFDRNQSIFDLDARRFVLDPGLRDLSVYFHGKPASTPLGPAAGPQSQLAQNLVLSFLGGGRIFELKTVQVQDRLKIPRPCIDMQTVGFNVEWSQELTLEESIEEYVKGSMLIEALVESRKLALAPGFDRTIFDLSVGYDLAGIQSERVQAFLCGMRDATPIVDRLRRELPPAYRDLDFTTRLSDTLTLSTFHGCPPDEIERMIDWLLTEHGLHCVVKLNPTLLGRLEARRIFNDLLGYEERIPETAFADDTQWDQAVDFVGRLGDRATALGLGFGVKFSNTLIVENDRDFFPKSERRMYLSGPPLHVLAMTLVDRFRQTFGDQYPVSFSAGIERRNFPDAVALGLCPVTVCSDLLRPKGYGRMQGYFAELERRMAAARATTVAEFVVMGYGKAEAALAGANPDPERLTACREALSAGGELLRAAGPALFARWVGEAKLLNTRHYAQALLCDPRYARAANSKIPRKIGSRLALLDCLTCDLCVPVCPNDANFTFTVPRQEIPVVKLCQTPGGWSSRHEGTLAVRERHQIGNVADLCNECGNCDVFCPEEGGPYLLKPRFFRTLVHWRRLATHDGFHLDRQGDRDIVHGRFEGREYRLELAAGVARYSGEGFELCFVETSPATILSGRAEVEVDLTYFHLMNWLRTAVLDSERVNYLNGLL